MTSRKLFWHACCLILLWVLFAGGNGVPTAQAYPAAQATATATILADRLNIRSGPGTGYAVAGAAVKGEQYTVVGQNGRCAWLKVAESGQDVGWISGNKSWVRLNTACAKVPLAQPPAPVAAPAGRSSTEGCATVINQLGFEVKIDLKRSDGWTDALVVPVGAEKVYCVKPGQYTATVSASGRPGAMSFPITVVGGENYRIPLSLGQ